MRRALQFLRHLWIPRAEIEDETAPDRDHWFTKHFRQHHAETRGEKEDRASRMIREGGPGDQS